MDASAWAYVSATGVLVAAELTALLLRPGKGDTITEKVKARTPLHAAMVSLLVWALYHFTAEDWTPKSIRGEIGVGLAVGGFVAGWVVSRKRRLSRLGQ